MFPTTTPLPDGQRVRVRLPQRADRARLEALCARLGLEADEVLLARTLRFDPRRGLTLVATCLVDRTEEILGVATMDRYADDPDLVLAVSPHVREVLSESLALYARRTA